MAAVSGEATAPAVASVSMAAVDFSGWFRQEAHSDCIIRIAVLDYSSDGDNPKPGQEQQQEEQRQQQQQSEDDVVMEENREDQPQGDGELRRQPPEDEQQQEGQLGQEEQPQGAQQEDQGQQAGPGSKNIKLKVPEMSEGEQTWEQLPVQPLFRVLEVVVEEWPGHGIVLSEGCEWARAQLTRPTELSRPEAGAGNRPVLKIVLEDEAQVEAAKLVLEVMYAGGTACEILQGTSHLTLLQVILLADRFGVHRCMDLATQLLCSTPSDDPFQSWEVMRTVYSLPDSCTQAPEFRRVKEHAQKVLFQRLGDLEVFVSLQVAPVPAPTSAVPPIKPIPTVQRLPAAALIDLLSSSSTRAFEEAIFMVATWWATGSKHPSNTKEARAALAACVRLPHISRLYLQTVVAHCRWFKQHDNVADINQAALWQEIRAQEHNRQLTSSHAYYLLGNDTVKRRKACWLEPLKAAPQRPEPCSFILDISLNISGLRGMHQTLVKGAPDRTVLSPNQMTQYPPSAAGYTFGLFLMAGYYHHIRKGRMIHFDVYPIPMAPGNEAMMYRHALVRCRGAVHVMRAPGDPQGQIFHFLSLHIAVRAVVAKFLCSVVRTWWSIGVRTY